MSVELSWELRLSLNGHFELDSSSSSSSSSGEGSSEGSERVSLCACLLCACVPEWVGLSLDTGAPSGVVVWRNKLASSVKYSNFTHKHSNSRTKAHQHTHTLARWLTYSTNTHTQTHIHTYIDIYNQLYTIAILGLSQVYMFFGDSSILDRFVSRLITITFIYNTNSNLSWIKKNSIKAHLWISTNWPPQPRLPPPAMQVISTWIVSLLLSQVSWPIAI